MGDGTWEFTFLSFSIIVMSPLFSLSRLFIGIPSSVAARRDGIVTYWLSWLVGVERGLEWGLNVFMNEIKLSIWR